MASPKRPRSRARTAPHLAVPLLLVGALGLTTGCAGTTGSSSSGLGPRAVEFTERGVVSRPRTGGGVDVYVDGQNITNFAVARQVLTAETSPDGRTLLVWHRQDAGADDRVIDLYTLRRTPRRIGQFQPDGRGRVAWATNNLIAHRYLREVDGETLAGLTVYEASGVPRWEQTGGGFLVDPSGAYAIQLPADDEPGNFAIYDLPTGRRLAQASADDVGESLGYQWMDPATVRAAYLDRNGQPRAIQLTLDEDRD